MERIAQVRLEGFKGLNRTYDLGSATLLSGPNGAGKSAVLEAIVYALSGRVPAGKNLDAVAQYFPDRGGSVTLADSAGRWVRRGIERDHEKAKVSVVLETSDTREGGMIDMSQWYATDSVLELREFLGLSPAKRREYVLALCGSNAAGGSEVFDSLESEYARQIAGPGAAKGFLDNPPYTDDGLHAIPKETEDARVAWVRPRGLREVLRSHLVVGKSVTEICLRLGDVAKEHRLGAGKAAKDAKAAIRELEAEAKGARAAATEIESRRKEVASAREELAAAREKVARADEAAKSAMAASGAAREARERLLKAQLDLGQIPAPGERPVPPQGDPRKESLLASYSEAGELFRDAEGEVMRFNLAREKLAALRVEEKDLKAQHEALRNSKLGRVVGLVSEMPDSADPMMPELRAAVDALAEAWQADMDKLEERVLCVADKIIAFGDDLSDAALATLTQDLKEAKEIRDEAVRALEALQKAQSTGENDYQARLRAWDAATRAHDHAALNLATAEEKLKGALETEEAAKARLKAVDEPSREKVDGLDARLRDALLAAETAEKAAGAATAYDAALRRAEQNTIEEAAWKTAEKAIAHVREKLVGEAVAPLIGVLGELLELAGRPEHPYLELENERGTATFELGWSYGETGERVSLQAMSGGESAIFCAALSLAIALRSEGRRLLLVEADPLDEGNLRAFLRAAAAWSDDLDALVVATASRIPEGATDDWTVTVLEDVGEVKAAA